MEIKKIIPAALCLLLLSATAATAQQASAPVQLRLEQASVELPKIALYFQVLDAAGKAVPVSANQLMTALPPDRPLTLDTLQSFKSTSDGIAYLFLVDISASYEPDHFQQVKQALRTWVGALKPNDQAALVTFGAEVEEVQAFTRLKQALTNKIDALSQASQNTQILTGIVRALEIAQSRQNLPARRVIVVFSDGIEDFPSGYTKEEAMTKIREGGVAVYTFGLRNRERRRPEEEKEEALKELGAFARDSGGLDMTWGGPSSAVAMRDQIDQVWKATLDCQPCLPDGKAYQLLVTVQGPETSVERRKTVFMPPPASDPDPDPSKTGILAWLGRAWRFSTTSWRAYVFGLLLLLGLMGPLLYIQRKKRLRPPPSPVPPTKPVRKPPPKKPVPPTVPVNKPKMKPQRQHPQPRPRARGVEISLTRIGKIEPGGEMSKTYTVSGRAVIGRKRTCNIVLDHDYDISSEHCELLVEEGTLYIRDLQSTNGTLVNGVAIVDKRKLENGDLILIGRSEYRFFQE